MKLLDRFYPSQPARVSLALLLLRLAVGAAFVLHGWGKIQHPTSWMGATSSVPALFQLLAAVSEFFGGIGWILGLMTPLASFGVGCTMSFALYKHMIERGDPFVGKGGPSYELALVYLMMAIALLLTGPGRHSLDALLFRRR